MNLAYLDFIGKQPRWLVLTVAVSLVLLIGVADYRTGYEVSLYVFYSIPILLVVWHVGRNAGLWISVFSALVWSTADFIGRSYDLSLHRFWNLAVQLTFFIFIVLGGAALKGQRDASRARVTLLERFHTLAQISPVGIFRAGLAGELLYVNERWRHIAGLTDAIDITELPARWTTALHPDDQDRVEAEWRRAVEQRLPCEFEARFQHCNGKTIWALGQVAPESDGHGGIAGYVGAITDMTELRRLEREVLEISEREQQRIGQDLHDDLCQQLVAAQYSATSLKRELRSRKDDAAEMAGELSDLLKGTVVRTRQMARRIFPVNLDQAGLMSALHELAENSSRFFDIACRFECPRPILLEDNATGAHLFRIAQEALSNAIRHGDAKDIRLSLSEEGHGLELSVRDNGCGFESPAGESTGMGLHIMNYRSRMIGATLRIEHAPTGGTIVRCTVPLHGGKLRALAEAAERPLVNHES